MMNDFLFTYVMDHFSWDSWEELLEYPFLSNFHIKHEGREDLLFCTLSLYKSCDKDQ